MIMTKNDVSVEKQFQSDAFSVAENEIYFRVQRGEIVIAVHNYEYFAPVWHFLFEDVINTVDEFVTHCNGIMEQMEAENSIIIDYQNARYSDR